MNKLSLALCLAFAFFVASAVAQMAPGGAQGTQNTNPGMSQPGQHDTQQPGMDQGQNPNNENRSNQERRLKGCVESQGGQYVLETRKGKAIALTGEDVSAHAGHEVALTGNWEKSGAASNSSTANAGTSERTFNVTNVKMISDTCTAKSKGTSGNMGTSSPQSGNNPPSSGTSNQPPQ
jgi:Protein of unknown function (DUF5818)